MASKHPCIECINIYGKPDAPCVCSKLIDYLNEQEATNAKNS
jgi:hypothetical protein